MQTASWEPHESMHQVLLLIRSPAVTPPMMHHSSQTGTFTTTRPFGVELLALQRPDPALHSLDVVEISRTPEEWREGMHHELSSGGAPVPLKDNGYCPLPRVGFLFHACDGLLAVWPEACVFFSHILSNQIYEESGLRALMGKCRGPRDTGKCKDCPGAQQQSQATAPPRSTLQSMRHDSSPSYDEEHAIGGSSRCRWASHACSISPQAIDCLASICPSSSQNCVAETVSKGCFCR